MDNVLNIKVSIAGREYCLKVSSPEEEENYRAAADSVNKCIELYQKKFLGKPETDILAFVAFNVCLANLKRKKAAEAAAAETSALEEEFGKYLENIGK